MKEILNKGLVREAGEGGSQGSDVKGETSERSLIGRPSGKQTASQSENPLPHSSQLIGSR
ncbi:hypothetical protein E2C01_039202 [Portunus trituberculatus]|uniref:Uncharacterized protein n=1 Tax=Portunus trituberculatus TaxID=210409 RepID=A0A5B7FK27_PORTR|nr:hypothetical protein [Portunus trituberculatus]